MRQGGDPLPRLDQASYAVHPIGRPRADARIRTVEERLHAILDQGRLD